tara:strand:+ start:1237 stop:1347 length:111 start_codon:yes stop_codon:yes gene_type:complete
MPVSEPPTGSEGFAHIAHCENKRFVIVKNNIINAFT